MPARKGRLLLIHWKAAEAEGLAAPQYAKS